MITKQMLSRDMQMLIDAGIIDVHKSVQMMREFGGLNIYVPTLSKEILKTLLMEEYNGKNIKELSMKYRRSERTIYSILSQKMHGKSKT